jgi:anthranilate/para-aminobenzoate synthase component II
VNARVLMIDNYDSFTYNLVQYLRMLGAEVLVHRNDALTVDEALALEPTHVVVSPGRARRATRASRSTSSAPSRAASRCSASASATRPSWRPGAATCALP